MGIEEPPRGSVQRADRKIYHLTPAGQERVLGGGPPTAQPVSSAQRAATVASLSTSPGVTAHSGPYPVAGSVIRFRGRTVDVVAEGRDRAPASVDQPEVTQGGWIRPGGVVIERGLADAFGIHVGEAVHLGGMGLVWLTRPAVASLAGTGGSRATSST